MRAASVVFWGVLWGCTPKSAAPQDDDEDGYAESDGDCNDADPTVHPGATEHCDGRDEDCDGVADEDAVDPVPAYLDQDGDGVFGATSVEACVVADDQSPTPGDDCDDTDPDVHPGAEERCNTGIDEDCDGTADACVRTGEVDTTDSELRLLGDGRYQWGATLTPMGDADGDGAADLAVGLSTSGLGGDGDGGVYILPIDGEGTTRLASAVASVTGIDAWAVPAYALASGDVDGDGGLDLLVGCPGPWSEAEPVATAQLYLSPFDDDRDADATDAFFVGSDEDSLGEAVALLPDADGDGLADVAIGAPWTGYDTNGDHDPGHIYVWFSGGAGGRQASADADLVIQGYNSGSHLGVPLAALPDVDGDGLSDLTAGAFYDASGGGGGVAHVFTQLAPGAADIGDARATLYTDDSSAACARSLSAWSDGLAVGCPGAGEVWLIPGAEARGYQVLEEGGWAAIPNPESEEGAVFPANLADPGDVDGDGRPDLLATALGAGSVWLYYGSGETLRITSARGPSSQLGWALAGADGNADGYPDLWIADPTDDAVWGLRGSGL